MHRASWILLLPSCLAYEANVPEATMMEEPRDQGPTQGDQMPADPKTPPPGSPAQMCPTFATAIEPLLSSGCAFAGCHSGAGAVLGLRLDPGFAFESLVGVPSQQSTKLRVVPSDPDASYLIEKLSPAPSTGSTMPLGRAPFDASTIGAIRDWIAIGAPEGSFTACEPTMMTTATPPADPAVALSIDAGGRTEIAVGEIVTLTAYAYDAEGRATSTAGATWVNEDEHAGYVDASGRLIGTAPGRARVRIELGDLRSEPIALGVIDAPVNGPSYASEVTPLLESRCALSGCHDDNTEAGDIAFDSGPRALYYDLIEEQARQFEGLDRVRRFDLDDSYLWLKLTRSHPPTGERMPANGAYLSVTEVDLVLRWILTGAYCGDGC
jgi:hypothetical protein